MRYEIRNISRETLDEAETLEEAQAMARRARKHGATAEVVDTEFHTDCTLPEDLP